MIAVAKEPSFAEGHGNSPRSRGDERGHLAIIPVAESLRHHFSCNIRLLDRLVRQGLPGASR